MQARILCFFVLASFTAAGSVVTEDVPAGALAIARGRQTNVEGYAERTAGVSATVG